jgi:hypothetical protein
MYRVANFDDEEAGRRRNGKKAARQGSYYEF